MSPATVELARRNLLAFVKLSKPDYAAGWVHREICARLMLFLASVMKGGSPRLMLTMPPRHGKSELVSRRFPAWALGVDPEISIISASYSDALARRMNKDVQRIMEAPEYSGIFPGTRLSDSKHSGAAKTQGLFEIPGHSGSYRSTGVGGGITGMGADILVIDDPVKDRAAADSPTQRDKVWDWYTSTAYTRLSPGGGVLVTLTRWHEDDLAGRLLRAARQDGGDKWTVVNYPAIAERDESHRRKGEALHPERYPLEALERIRANVGEYDWGALYQQHPTPVSGGIFKREWFKHYSERERPVFFDIQFQSWDFTFKDAAGADNVCGTVWGKKGAEYYLLDRVKDRMSFTASVDAMLRMTAKWPHATAKYVEAKANGEAIISVLGNKIPGIVAVSPKESKVARANAVTPLFRAGNVLFPTEAPWLRDYEAELASFPNGEHDDQVDSTTQGLSQTMEHFNIWEIL